MFVRSMERLGPCRTDSYFCKPTTSEWSKTGGKSINSYMASMHGTIMVVANSSDGANGACNTRTPYGFL
jgi:hypothetical protein